MKRLPFSSARLFWLAPLTVLLMLALITLFGNSVPVARGKITAVPLTDQLSASQRLAQEAALADSRVVALTEGRRTEVFGVLDLRGEFTPNSAECATTTCYQVEIYNFDENAAVAVIVNPAHGRVLDVLHRPGIQPGINKRLADLAIQLAITDPELIATLGYKPLKANLAPVPAGMPNSVCGEGHLCAAPTFRHGDRLLWAMVDLTDEKIVGLAWTEVGPDAETTTTPFIPDGCPASGTVNRAGWSMGHSVTGGDGLRVHTISFNGVAVASSIKLMEWHASYGASGFVDSVGCGGGGGFQIFPYGDTQVLDLLDGEGEIIGFELMQDFRMSNWGGTCNYRYDQRVQFYNDGRFRVLSGAYGKGCGNNATYRPVVRMDLAVTEAGEQSFATWDGSAWQPQPTEFWELQSAPYTAALSKWLITHASGQGYYIVPAQNRTGSTGRGDNAYLYVTQHKPAEGDTDLGVMSSCCHNDHRQGPENFINGESISNQNLVVWYVPQMVTDITPNKLYCWTVTGEPNPETYPCFGGPLFVPKAYNSFTSPALVALGDTAVFTSTAAGVLPLSYTWDFGDGLGTSTDPNPSYQFATPGTFTVTLTTTGANGESATSLQTVAVTGGVSAGFEYITPLLLGETSLFTNTSVSKPPMPLSYTWDFGDEQSSTLTNPTHVYAQSGLYTVTLTVSNSMGTDTASALVEIVAPPTAVIDPAGPAVIQQPITLSHSSTGTTPLTVTWDWGDETTSTDESPSHSYAATGQYTVTLTVSNSWGADTAVWPLTVGDATAVVPAGAMGQLIGQGITFTLPAGSTAQELTLLYTITDKPADWDGYVSAGHSFNWSVFVAGVQLTPYSFAAPIAVRLDVAVDAAGLDPASLLLLYWNGSAWVSAAEACGNQPVRRTQTAQLETEICAAGDFVLVGRVLVHNGTTQYLPLILR